MSIRGCAYKLEFTKFDANILKKTVNSSQNEECFDILAAFLVTYMTYHSILRKMHLIVSLNCLYLGSSN